MLADVKLVTLHRAPVTVCRSLLLLLKPWNPADGVERELVAVEVVQHDHVKGSRRGSLIPKATHMKIVMVVPPIGQPVDDSRIAVERKDHWLVAREHCIEILVLQPMRMLARRLQGHEVDDIHDSDADVRNVVSQERYGCESFEGGNIAGAGHDHVGVARIVARPLPDAGADCAVANGGLDIEPLPLWLLAGDDQVDVVPAAETMIGNREQSSSRRAADRCVRRRPFYSRRDR